MKPTDNILIAYIDGKLNSDEVKELEEILNKDPNAKKELELLLLTHKVVSAGAFERRREALTELGDELLKKGPSSFEVNILEDQENPVVEKDSAESLKKSPELIPSPSPGKWRAFAPYLAVAATIILAVWLGWDYLFPLTAPQYDQLANNYLALDTDTLKYGQIQRRQLDTLNITGLQEEAVSLFNAQEYEQAFSIWEELYSNTQDAKEKAYCLLIQGRCQLNMGNTEAAIKIFNDGLEEEEDSLIDKYQWYLLIAYLRQGNPPIIQQAVCDYISLDHYFQHAEAREIKKELRIPCRED